MFTGIVQAKGRVVELTRHRTGARLVVDPLNWPHRPAVGDSISVSGCCLTVAAPVEHRDPRFVFDMIPETLKRTRLGELKVGELANLEHAATMATFLGGHLVQGHVDGLAEVVAVARPRATRGRDGRPTRRPRGPAGEWRIRLAVPTPRQGQSDPSAGDLMQYLVPKGSVCVDGVSLTVAALWDEGAGAVPDLGSRAAGHARPRRGSANGPHRLESRRGFEVALIPETLRVTTLGDLRAGDRVNLEVDAIAKTVVNWMRWHAASGQMPTAPPPAWSPTSPDATRGGRR